MLQQDKVTTLRKCAICEKCNMKRVQHDIAATLKSAT